MKHYKHFLLLQLRKSKAQSAKIEEVFPEKLPIMTNNKMKNNPTEIIFHKRAIVALDALSMEDRKSLLKAINHLSILGIDSALGKDVKKFKIDESLYLLKVNPGFRIIFRLTERDEVEILDIVMKERLELFAASKS